MKTALIFAAGLTLIGLLIQIIPYGHDHSIPPVNDEPQWPGQEVHNLARRACFDCHSHETTWPWYSNIAPVSWMIYHDVAEGRHHVDFSDWDRPAHQHVDEFQKVFENRSMPRPTTSFFTPPPASPKAICRPSSRA